MDIETPKMMFARLVKYNNWEKNPQKERILFYSPLNQMQ